MLRKIIPVHVFTLALTLASLVFLPQNLRAELPSEALVTVRFNQPNVRFEAPLSNAIGKAVAINPEIAFTVISYAPTTGNAATDKQWQSVAGHNTRAVIAAMNSAGVPMSRITVIGQAASGIQYDETRVFLK